MKTSEIMQRLKRCESMCLAGKAATQHFLKAYQQDQSHFANAPFRIRDIRDCHEDLDTTYLIRIFALFETALRDFWSSSMNRPTHPRAQHLLNTVAARQNMPVVVLDHAHAVREYRNSLLHGALAPTVTLAEARSYLCTFLADLPRDW